MPLPERAGPASGRLDASAVAGFVDALAAHEIRCLADVLALAPAALSQAAGVRR